MSKFNKLPEIFVEKLNESVSRGYEDIVAKLAREQRKLNKDKVVIAIECYPGVNLEEIFNGLILPLHATEVYDTDDFYYSAHKVTEMLQYNITSDRVFGIYSHHTYNDFFDDRLLEDVMKAIKDQSKGLVVIYGVGASLVAEADILIYADLTRWEIQQRFDEKMPNWKANNHDEETIRKIKRSYFIEWPMADKLKKQIMENVDYWLDTNVKNDPKMVDKENYMLGLKQIISQPFRLVPFFAPGVWGGQWMKEKFGLDPNVENYAWSFNGVPAENSIYLKYGDTRVEIPANNVVFQHPEELLGSKVYGRFGKEFPIRFNFLDTVEGQNLSLQVHPTTDYVQETFGAPYTQDESYYILHAEEESVVYLGLKSDIHKEDMIADLEEANKGLKLFEDEKYVNQFPIKKHDHFSIPGGTIHSQGKGSVVLEISSTPNIYTFKLWDWGRLGLDGVPRPVHLNHGINSIQWEREEQWVKENLINPIEKIESGKGWEEERTGLHEMEFIETRRHWFSDTVYHQTHGSVNVFNLVEGEEAIVECLNHTFEPFIVRYAETFIIPECIKEYTIRPYGKSIGKKIATIKAFVKV